MNERNRNSKNGNINKNELDQILNENANSMFEGTRSVEKAAKASGNPTMDKAKSEINSQADAMLREIEERRQRRAARQRELEQQMQAEMNAKEKRQARIKAYEDAQRNIRNSSPREASVGSVSGEKKSIPSVSSSDSKFKNINNITQPDTLDRFSSAPSQKDRRNTTPSTAIDSQKQRPTRQRRTVQSGETQIMPKISEAHINADIHQVGRRPSSPDYAQKRSSSSDVPRRRPAKPHSGPPSTSDTRTRTSRTGQNKKNNPKEVNTMKEIRDWAVAIGVAIVVSLLIRNFVFTLVQVQGESMQPTLQNEDRLYVNRFIYSPNKGDVVIFKPESDPKKPYVKRVIATEGDTVYIDPENGDVYVNDQIIDEPYIKANTNITSGYISELIRNNEYSRDNPIVIEKDKIFVMGDNRTNSKDSRMIGQVPESELIGGAVFRFWPLNKFGSVSYKTTTSYLIEDDENNFTFLG